MGLFSGIKKALFGGKTKKSATDTTQNTTSSSDTYNLSNELNSTFSQGGEASWEDAFSNQEAWEQLNSNESMRGFETESSVSDIVRNLMSSTRGFEDRQLSDVTRTFEDNRTDVRNRAYDDVAPQLASYRAKLEKLFQGNGIGDLEQFGMDRLKAAATADDPLLAAAQAEMIRTMQGDYLGLDKNPYLRQIGQAVSGDTMGAVNSAFGGMGRTSGGLHSAIAGEKVGDALARLYGGAYESERGRMGSATVNGPASLISARLLAPQALIKAGESASRRPFEMIGQEGDILAKLASLDGGSTTTQTNRGGSDRTLSDVTRTGSDTQTTDRTTESLLRSLLTGSDTTSSASSASGSSSVTSREGGSTNYQNTIEQALAEIFGSEDATGSLVGNETQSKYTKGLLGQIFSAKNVASAIMAASERRVKRDITRVGERPDGLGLYDFRYVWDADDAPLRRGVMVDEVERIAPHALGPIINGIQTVNYTALGMEA